MKKKILHLLSLLLIANFPYGPLTGSTMYSLENDIIPVGNESAVITVDDENALSFKQGAGAVIGQNGSHGIKVENADPTESLNGKTEVWDFGAVQLDDAIYVNRLDVAGINAWYTYADDQQEGQPGRNVPATFTAGSLTWTSNSASSDRLRTTNESLTRYDANISSPPYTGRLYINGSAQSERYFSLVLDEDDEVKIVALSQNGKGILNFVSVANPESQTDLANLTSAAAEYNFVAKQAGVYRMYDTVDKPSYFRIYRRNAVYATVSGTVDVTKASGISAEYSIVFTNEAGKMWRADPSSGSYAINLPVGYTYSVGLADANGYVISSTTILNVTGALTNNVVIQAVALNTLSGDVTGLGNDLSNLSLVYTPVDETKIFEPSASIDISAGTYSVQLEPNTEYTIKAKGVNDYTIGSSSVTITADREADVVFAAKPTYAVTINTPDLSSAQRSALSLTFTNFTEEGYAYTFSDLSKVVLRDGVYAISYAGMDAYPIQMGLTANLKISGAPTSKTLAFADVTAWTFDDITASGLTAYKGITFSNGVSIRGSSNKDLVTGAVEVISVPVKVGQKIVVTYYYHAAFNFNGGADIIHYDGGTASSEYVYEGAVDGVVAINVIDASATTSKSNSYFKQIEVLDVVDYAAVITVGVDKDYKTIDDALNAIALMDRTSEQRVTVQIDPGNYEEMLVVDVDHVSFTNASAEPSVALKNGGVNIDDNAVRITSYYGHGYNYFSMANNQKWNSETLSVNRENGFLSYENAGSGTTNGSFWNATVVVMANGFEAHNIIFENSFNQYISEKESQDVVIEWSSGSKGARPTNAGNTAVQSKSFVERAAALAIDGGDKMILNNCRLVGRQDVFYGGVGSRVAVYKGVMMGGTDYIFGGMTAVFYKADMAMNTSEDPNDVSYITAGQQGAGDRGYLMYHCTITSAIPGVDNTATYRSKPGSFGRCWSGPTCEVIFYNTTIETSDNPSFNGKSLIVPEGWSTGLGGPSLRVGELGTTERSGVNNTENRFKGAEVSGDWGSTVLSSAVTRGDAVALTPVNFTDNGDGWNPIAALISNDPSTAITPVYNSPAAIVYAANNEIVLSNIQEDTMVRVYNTSGAVVKSVFARENSRFSMPNGCWVVHVSSQSGSKSVKVVTL